MRPLNILLGVALALSAALPASAQALKDLKPRPPLTLSDQGSFFVGGRKIHSAARTGWKVDSGDRYAAYQQGTWTVDQMYVEFEAPVDAKRHLPVVMVHGCCLTSKTWETTPDGRMGWYEYFVRHGRATYLAEQVGRARSGFDATSYNQARQGKVAAETTPAIHMATEELAWDIFRFGPKYGQSFADEQFPVAYLGEMFKQVIPDLSTTVPSPNPTWADMATLSNDLGGAILMGHSQSGFYPEMAALADPKGVRAMISLEPGGCSTATLKPADYAILAKIPTIVVYGDHLDGTPLPNWVNSIKDCRIYAEKLKAMGGDVTVLHLPEIGIKGNSHMFMQDRNSLELADLMLKWIDEHVEHAAKR